MVAVPLPAAARNAAVSAIGRAAGRGRGPGTVAAALLPGLLMIFAGTVAILMTAPRPAEPAGMRVLVGQDQRPCW